MAHHIFYVHIIVYASLCAGVCVCVFGLAINNLPVTVGSSDVKLLQRRLHQTRQQPFVCSMARLNYVLCVCVWENSLNL